MPLLFPQGRRLGARHPEGDRRAAPRCWRSSACCCALLLQKTKVGLSLRAVASNPESSRAGGHQHRHAC